MLLTWGSSQGLNALMNSAEFIAGFADKGSGEVDLTLAKGTGSATFTRATTATTVNSSGQIISVASGTPRSYYDPTSLAYLGYLSEGARTNDLTQSGDLTSFSVTPATGLTSSLSAITAPDGTTSGRSLTNTITTENHRLFQSMTVLNVTTYTYSVFAKNNTAGWLQLSASFTTLAFANFNLATGTVGTSGNTTATIKAYPNGWYRCSMTVTTATTSGNIQLYVLEADPGVINPVTTATVKGLYVWGAQFEVGSFASTYIPTTTAAVTRNADLLTYPFSGNALTTAGSVYAELSTFWTSGVTGIAVGFDTGNNLPLFVGGGAATVISTADGTTTVTKSGLSSMATGIRKRASSYGGSEQLITGDGVAPQSGSFDGAMASTAIAICSGTGGGSPWFGTIRNVRIYQTQLSASQLQAVTA